MRFDFRYESSKFSMNWKREKEEDNKSSKSAWTGIHINLSTRRWYIVDWNLPNFQAAESNMTTPASQIKKLISQNQKLIINTHQRETIVLLQSVFYFVNYVIKLCGVNGHRLGPLTHRSSLMTLFAERALKSNLDLLPSAEPHVHFINPTLF